MEWIHNTFPVFSSTLNNVLRPLLCVAIEIHYFTLLCRDGKCKQKQMMRPKDFLAPSQCPWTKFKDLRMHLVRTTTSLVEASLPRSMICS